MLHSFSQSQDWLYSEPLLFDDDFCQSLMKDLQSLPTPPQSPPIKPGLGAAKPLSKEDQLSYVSDILLEDDMMQMDWNNCHLFPEKEQPSLGLGRPASALEESADGEDCLWRCLATEPRGLDERLVTSVLGSSPLLSDIDTSIFQEIAGSTLDCQDLLEVQETSEATSDYGSAGGELSTYSSSDSEEEIDVVTVVRCSSSSPSPLPSLAERAVRQKAEEDQRRHLEITLQHNYAAPCPASPPPSSSSGHKRSRAHGDASRFHYSSSRSSSSSSSFSSSHSSSRYQAAEADDEEERRRSHNVMERQRRNELKNCFVRLRDTVPELSLNHKASKVLILKRARDCIHSLDADAHRLQAKRDRLRERQAQLKTRLQTLRS